MQRYYWIPSAFLAAAMLLLYLGTRAFDGTAGRDGSAPDMPAGLGGDAERELFFTPGGLYSPADMQANGMQSASQAFRGFHARHDLNPRPGDRLCPVTRTKANPECSWVIGGRRYQFCCPPCVGEFVLIAKEAPDEVRPPEEYVK